MQMYNDNQTDFKFNDPAAFQPEYMPAEVPSPFMMNKSISTEFSRKGRLGKFFSLTKVSSFLLESMEKSNEFSVELNSQVREVQGSVNETSSRLDKLNERFSSLEGKIQLMTGEFGDFQYRVRPILEKLSRSEAQIDEKIRKIEDNGLELKSLKAEMVGLRSRDKMLWIMISLSMGVNVAAVYYILR